VEEHVSRIMRFTGKSMPPDFLRRAKKIPACIASDGPPIPSPHMRDVN